MVLWCDEDLRELVERVAHDPREAGDWVRIAGSVRAPDGSMSRLLEAWNSGGCQQAFNLALGLLVDCAMGLLRMAFEVAVANQIKGVFGWRVLKMARDKWGVQAWRWVCWSQRFQEALLRGGQVWMEYARYRAAIHLQRGSAQSSFVG